MKKRMSELAVFGGASAFQEKLHVGRPNIGNREQVLQRIADMLDRHWLSNHGCYVQELERRIADLLGVKHCIAMCNATVALEIASRALDLRGEVIVPSFTFIATAHALQWQEITPVFCDVDPVTHCLNPWRIESINQFCEMLLEAYKKEKPFPIHSVPEKLASSPMKQDEEQYYLAQHQDSAVEAKLNFVSQPSRGKTYVIYDSCEAPISFSEGDYISRGYSRSSPTVAFQKC